MIDYGYGDSSPQGYDLSGVPMHSIKHEHFTMDDYMLSKVSWKQIHIFADILL